MDIYYCQSCSIKLSRKKRFCGSVSDKTGCAIKFLRKEAKEYYWKNREKRIKYQLSYKATEHGRNKRRQRQRINRDKDYAYYREWYKKNGRKRNIIARWAQGKVAYAIQRGELMRQEKCEKCGIPTKTEAHHPDYSKPLEVLWLCRICHKAEHHPISA